MNNVSLWQPSRRDVLWLGVAGFLTAVPFATRRPLTLVRRNVLVMGTLAEFAVAHRDPVAANAAIDAGIARLRDVDTTMSRFKPASDVGRANSVAAHTPVSVSTDTMTVLTAAARWADDSGGVFDPCLGRAMTLWDIPHRHEPPPPPHVMRFARRQLYRSMELGQHQGDGVVVFRDEDVQIDLGGIAKGYGVDQAVAALRDHGVEHALVGAGGDLFALGRSPSNEPWHVGIQSPDEPDALVATLRLEDAAVATSGDYQQFFIYRNQRYHHLLDANTGAPRQTTERSVSVTAATCMAADAGATVAFGYRGRPTDAVLARHGARVVHWI